jgi:2-amino-4-hydroxy-6-hydroxymethyldihydropteridine diphosphokinase
MNAVTAYIGLGANLGPAQSTLSEAIEAIGHTSGITQTLPSRFFVSEPVDAPGPAYVNAVLKVQTTLAPLNLLAILRHIEVAFGRERHFRNAPRTLDLDLLLYDALQFTTPTLTVPHPRLHLRAFVLKPLIELAGPSVVVNGQRLEQWLLASAAQACEPI